MITRGRHAEARRRDAMENDMDASPKASGLVIDGADVLVPCVSTVPPCAGCCLPAVPRHCCRCGKLGGPCVVEQRRDVDLATGEVRHTLVYCGID